jgi:hypothetical protein
LRIYQGGYSFLGGLKDTLADIEIFITGYSSTAVAKIHSFIAG